jgi:DNA polymerase-3 subunit gamma/tau
MPVREASRSAAPSFRDEPPLEQVPVDAYEQESSRPFVDDGIPEPVFMNTVSRPAVQPASAPSRTDLPAGPARFEAPKPAPQRPAPAFQPPQSVMARSAKAAVPSSDSRLTDSRKTVETQGAPLRREEAEWKKLPVDTTLTWENFLISCEGDSEIPIPVLRQFTGEVRGDWLVLQPLSQIIGQQIQRPEKLKVLENLAERWAGRPLRPAFKAPQKIVRTEAEIKEELGAHPVVKRFQEAYDALLVRCTPVNR